MANDAVESFLPSGLVPNESTGARPVQARADDDRVPVDAPSRRSSTTRPRAPFITKLMDLADPRLKGKVTLPAPGDITAGGFLLGLAAELGQGLQGPGPDEGGRRLGDHQHRTERRQVHLRLVGDAAAARGPARSMPCRFWNSLGRLEYFSGHTDTALLVPAERLPGQRLPVDPEGRAAPGPRPDLHQLAARHGRPVPERLADRARSVERAERGLPRPGLRRTRSPTGSRPTTSSTTRPSTRSRPTSRRSTGRPTTRASRSGRTTTPRRPPVSDDRPAAHARRAEAIDGD